MNKRLSKLYNKPLAPKTQEIVNYRFANPKATQKQIAVALGVSPVRISVVLNSDRVMAVYPLLARRSMKALIPEASAKMGELMRQNENLEVSRKVTERVLADQKVLDAPEIHVKSTLEIKTIYELQDIVKEAAAIPEPCIDAEIVTVGETDVETDVNK